MTGLAANFKLDAALYEAPMALYVIWRDEAQGRRWHLAASGFAGFAVAFALPFTGIDAANYLATLKLSNDRGIQRTLVEQDVLMIAFLLMPSAWMCLFHRRRLPRGLVAFFAATVISMLVILYPASKFGAGPHHFLPYLPSLCWALLVLYRAARIDPARFASVPGPDASVAILLLAIAPGYSPIDAQAWDFTLRNYGTAPVVRQAIAEINAVLAAHPGVSVALGPGFNANIDEGALRVIPVFEGNPPPIDPVTWKDEQFGYGSERVAVARKILRECKIDLWLIPRGVPFASLPDQAMFTGDVLRDFLDNYRLEAAGPQFELWQCDHKPGVRP
jgi:hypothetical protein